MKDYITESSNKSRKQYKGVDIYGKPFIFTQPFQNDINLDYVSCSPYRVPIARLSAAKNAIRTNENL